ncbi:CmpA/NrtA family ABC transporter substrate-binding protein [Ectopseudomonas alcaliphila]|uniref:CmpA/NrtA family ABC transporter substrate-binding protein n=1 Tax=Ectopseudomonas alcaliphila TaxID=101564 RepID=A0A1G7E5E9_9GAMM|nr:CmpA/NrtA family ABC transporter substrate-binding protein [Pseudomonas alcaliphila]MDX5990712.1 CmpA/NrtA family ABC transporter substrate-binding protein [Pseudomonas alcaliphila]SDE58892.1 nitrate/nitrite transport system substrate-binding protein [Pseudomonas alcaliphila]
MTDRDSNKPLATSRRNFLKQSIALAGAVSGIAALGLSAPASLRSAAWAAGSDAPEKAALTVGFIPLTDCASVVVAATQGFGEKYGLTINPSKEASWAGVRDKLNTGELDAAHVLYGMMYGAQLGLAGPQRDMAVLMGLNQNGQAITLSKQLREAGVSNGVQLAEHVKKGGTPLTFAQTFPTGTHAMWLYYWLGSLGINPMSDVKTIVVPPPQMVANMRVGNMDGFCVGEPWGARAIFDKIGFTATTTQQIWPDHPEKVLGTTRAFIEQYPNAARALIMAILDASRFIEASEENRKSTAKLISGKAYVNAPVQVIEPRFLAQYEDGLGNSWKDEHAMAFCKDGSVNFPYHSDGMWFLTQFKRWGLLKDAPDYAAVAAQINQTALYAEAASALKLAVPSSPLRSSTLIDGVVWDGSNPAAYADSFAIKA